MNGEGIDIANAPQSVYGEHIYRQMDRRIMREPLPVPATIPQAQIVPAPDPFAALFDFSTLTPWLILGGIALAIYLMSQEGEHE